MAATLRHGMTGAHAPQKDIVLVGAGVIGLSIARMLAARKLRVAIVDRGAPGDEASSAAAGMLAPSAEAGEPGAKNPLFALARASLRLFPRLVDELAEETGIDPQYRTDGTVLPFADQDGRDRLWRELEWQRGQGVPVAELPAAELARAEPALEGFAGAFLLPEDHQINTRAYLQALVSSCRMRGVDLLLGESVTGIAFETATGRRRIAGVRIGDRILRAPLVINTAGAWAAEVTGDDWGGEGAGLRLPIRPVKGHMLSLGLPPGALRHVIRRHHAVQDVYLVPRLDGTILVGSTMEEAGFDKIPRAGAVSKLIEAAIGVCPALRKAELASFWAGLRPATPDCLPMLGPLYSASDGEDSPAREGQASEGYWAALGHFRNGILLSPITAQWMTEWIAGGRPPAGIAPFLPSRFQARPL